MTMSTTTHPVERGFDTPAPIDLFVENGSGSVAITATETQRTTVHVAGKYADEVSISQDGEGVSVVAPKLRGGFFGNDTKLDIDVVVPTGSRVVVKTGSADIEVSGTVGATKIKSGSGEVVLDVVDDVAVVDTGSGDIRIEEARGELRIRSGSGDVVIGSSTTAAVSTGSGDVQLDRTSGPVIVKTGSGDLEVGEASGDVAMNTGSGDTVIRKVRRGKITSKGASGDVRIGIPEGTPVWTDIRTVTGHLSSAIEGVGEPEPGADSVELRATTVSGDVVLVQA
jgi:DUF4097 and DUF4098 domain-containing protein YvlB